LLPARLGFFGAITACVSHEINNVLATTNELAGLLDDMLQAADQGHPLDPDRLRNLPGRIARQVERGQTHVRRLNRFAHTVDHLRTTFDVNQTLGAINNLCQRFGKLRKVTIPLSLPDASPQVEGNPFDLQHLFYRAIDLLLRATEEGGTIEITVTAPESALQITFASSAELAADQPPPRCETLAALVGGLGGELTDPGPCTGPSTVLTVTLPRRLGSLDESALQQVNGIRTGGV
jgi:C4-dicarboxylate-specific signal transduction histidine kinase